MGNGYVPGGDGAGLEQVLRNKTGSAVPETGDFLCWKMCSSLKAWDKGGRPCSEGNGSAELAGTYKDNLV